MTENAPVLHIRSALLSSIRLSYPRGQFSYDFLHGGTFLWTWGPTLPEDVCNRFEFGTLAPIIDQVL